MVAQLPGNEQLPRNQSGEGALPSLERVEDLLLQLLAAGPEQSRVASITEFSLVLHRERSRADRLHDEFTLILITGASPALIGALEASVESPEELGWIDHRTLGLLLPHTTASQAFERIEQRFGYLRSERGLSFERLTYPGDVAPVRLDLADADAEPPSDESRRRRLRPAGFAGTLLSLISVITTLVDR